MESFVKSILISIASTLMLSAPYLLERRFRIYEEAYENNVENIKKNLTEVKQQLKQCTTLIQSHVTTQEGQNKVEKNCHTCANYLVSGPNGVSDEMVSWSSVYNRNHRYFRLYAVGDDAHSGAWCALTNDVNQYIQVNFAESRTVTGVITWERDRIPQWIKTYHLLYTEDMMAWHTYDKNAGTAFEFQGNDGSYIPRTNCLSPPVKARAIRINPRTWHKHVSMRFDIIGC